MKSVMLVLFLEDSVEGEFVRGFIGVRIVKFYRKFKFIF